uniref:DUF2145 domain-containing protein n=1 Tax=Phenylobacterium glaciei TaxID=2803784 RepID=A0A974P6P0_9CAUL|nr:DUF2145 domain-containing protein [Phenylobacterium glaciei]
MSAVPASVAATGSMVAGSAVMASGAASVGVGGAVSEAATDSGRLVVDDKVVVSPIRPPPCPTTPLPRPRNEPPRPDRRQPRRPERHRGPARRRPGFFGQRGGAHFTAPEAAAFSKQVERDLAGRGAKLAMVFRTGRPRSQLPEGISYTHGAFWVYRNIKTADGQTQQATPSTTSMPATEKPGPRSRAGWSRTIPSTSPAAPPSTTWPSSSPRRRCSAGSSR